jgi:hypothetical protein
MLAQKLDELQNQFGALLRAWQLPRAGDLVARYGDDAQDRLYLIRPDGYVGHRCRAADSAQIAMHLRHWLFAPAA